MKNLTSQERRNIEKQAKEEVIKEADIIICTLNFSGNQLFECLTCEKNEGRSVLNAIIIDEVIEKFNIVNN